jgi:diaminohydroxyphosphoribosylaminopyrimidine deaminase/5-amino-6-(5-phosphoribosylamino)uracil reductase
MAAPRGVTLKLATSLDGRIATASGESQWITSEEARRAAHLLRAEHDAVLVGVETGIADDPQLTVRLDGYRGPQPARVVLDSRQRLPLNSQLALTARQARTVVLTTSAPTAGLADLGVTVIQVTPDADGRPHPRAALAVLAETGLNRIMVEGGGRVAASFLSLGLVDRIEWFRAPILLGSAGRPAVGVLALHRLAEAPCFTRLDVNPVGPDLWERYVRV